ncbi:hypothetical protein H206_03703 [Candidatus Electrothrix aarhusensis]|uniref:Uncharacterized protein n=1 Tax=Candidatus Electrothrix aarhusensis TaxID=1859131 RepID=A0A3S3R2V8_9BACT|nr:hypothetical protein H206_03703 [Candidatus Electrothrix aarhusensis]
MLRSYFKTVNFQLFLPGNLLMQKKQPIPESKDPLYESLATPSSRPTNFLFCYLTPKEMRWVFKILSG